MLELDFAQLSDPGRLRGHNEDFLGYVLPETPEQMRSHGWLFALADGVGGQDLGEVASRTAVESVLAGFRGGRAAEPHLPLLARLVQAANTKVYEAGKSALPGGAAMATTLVVCALRFDRLTLGHVGDSRCYLLRRGQAHLLTRDHTVVGEQVRLGVMSAAEARKAETRHLLTRSVGNDLFVSADTSEHHIFAGDVIVLCSDGLHGPIRPDEIARVTGEAASLPAAAGQLVELANQRDGSDNVSLQLLRVRATERMGMYRGRPYKLP
jgi:serine/threonine protein phosphatase PrpC